MFCVYAKQPLRDKSLFQQIKFLYIFSLHPFELKFNRCCSVKITTFTWFERKRLECMCFVFQYSLIQPFKATFVCSNTMRSDRKF